MCLAIWYAGCLVFGRAMIGVVYRVLRDGGHVRRNFQGRDIPASLGVSFGLLAMAMAPAAALVMKPYPGLKTLSVLAVAAGFCALGFVDDAIISRERGGIAGHLKKMVRSGRVSTALLKAFFGLALSLGITLAMAGGGAFVWYQIAINTLIIALSANAVNLLDVKPGRAIKGFLFALAALVGGSLLLQRWGGRATVEVETLVLIVPFGLWALASWGLDLRCKAMMGDAGSNALGAVLGLTAVWELSLTSRLIVLALLVAYHLVCEIGSLSAIIQSVAPLRWADNFGVKLLAQSKEEKKKKQTLNI